MKPTNQTKFSLFYSNGDRMTYGNCLVACIASILEVPIDEVPNVYVFYGIKETDQQDQPIWLSVLNDWLMFKHSLKLVKVTKYSELSNGYFIARGFSKRNKPHCVVMHKLMPDFDPHPTSEGLKSIDYYYEFKHC